MEWRDDAFVLAARRHGETSAVVQLLTRAHGRHAGLVRGGAGRRSRALIEAGNRVSAHWRGRLADQLGTLALEPVRASAARLIDRPRRLAALASACALLAEALPERAPHPAAHDALIALLAALEDGDEAVWPAVYVRWELGLLAELGFGLELTRCAVTGAATDLGFVSPRTGHVVSRAAAAPYTERLLALPRFLIGEAAADASALHEGLLLTGHFLERQVFGPNDRPLPAARTRLAALIAGDALASGRAAP